ncbi:hypothetical protein [Actinoplanes sp. N902-109]|uniref:hypothetical protein n=1 Tax=Actinoplanes sp. (strain N902-109) TaxID=649831 RepID=UPI00032936CE|nr:hypothetical protein [Actinoplanes sp. N902-109]AGL16263.1 hypothetical protein L083_2753 [Actinoplanes sp. N902-109]
MVTVSWLRRRIGEVTALEDVVLRQLCTELAPGFADPGIRRHLAQVQVRNLPCGPSRSRRPAGLRMSTVRQQRFVKHLPILQFADSVSASRRLLATSTLMPPLPTSSPDRGTVTAGANNDRAKKKPRRQGTRNSTSKLNQGQVTLLVAVIGLAGAIATAVIQKYPGTNEAKAAPNTGQTSSPSNPAGASPVGSAASSAVAPPPSPVDVSSLAASPPEPSAGGTSPHQSAPATPLSSPHTTHQGVPVQPKKFAVTKPAPQEQVNRNVQMEGTWTPTAEAAIWTYVIAPSTNLRFFGECRPAIEDSDGEWRGRMLNVGEAGSGTDHFHYTLVAALISSEDSAILRTRCLNAKGEGLPTGAVPPALDQKSITVERVS